MKRTCTECRQPFTVHPEEQAFLEKMAFRFGEKVVELPFPEHCPMCRLQLKTCHRNERFLYHGKSDFSGNDMVSLYAATPIHAVPYTVFTHDEWHADTWDATEHAKTLDLNRPFFDQWAELHMAVPRMGLITIGNENSDFTTGTGFCRNCYLINSSEHCEDCFYGKLLQSSRDCVDCSYTYDCEACYECLTIYNCHSCSHLLFSKNCSDCFFSTNLIGCKNCLLSSNLHQKEYHIRNRQVPRAEFEEAMKKIRGSAKAAFALKEELKKIERKRIHRAGNIVNCEACTGDYLENCKHCIDCFDVTDSEDCRHAYAGVSIKDLQHCANMYLKVELCLDVLGAIEVYHSAYCLFCFYCEDLLYCEYCLHCRDCFGCNGLRHKRYCILNKQYTKEEYETLVPKIIQQMTATPQRLPDGSYKGQAGSWGKFFPRSHAPFGYNESLAQEYFPLSRDEATARGFLWRDVSDPKPDREKIIDATDLPDRIEDIPDDILDWAIRCERSGRLFRLIKQELAFYRNKRLPVPRLHPDIRYDDRLKLRNPRKLWTRNCKKCGKAIQTTYEPSRPETICCEECFLKEIY